MRENLLKNLRIKIPKSKLNYDQTNINLFSKNEEEIEIVDKDEEEYEVDKFMSIDVLRARKFKTKVDEVAKLIQTDQEKQNDFDMSDFIKSVVK